MKEKPILLLAETGFIIRNLLLGYFAGSIARKKKLIVAVKNPNDKNLQEIIKGQNVEFIYILFSRTDENERHAREIGEYITSTLPFHILYQETSFIANLPDNDNIYHCVKGSKKCIVLLTNDFFSDSLAVQALFLSLSRGFSYHITVGVPPLPLEDLFNREYESLRGLLHRPNVVEYPNDADGREVAKRRIISALE